MTGTVALAGARTLVFVSVHKLISLVIKQSIERFFDTVTYQIFEIILYEILVKLYDVRKGYQKDLIMKALEASSRSLDEILSFINTTIEDAKGCED